MSKCALPCITSWLLLNWVVSCLLGFVTSYLLASRSKCKAWVSVMYCSSSLIYILFITTQVPQCLTYACFESKWGTYKGFFFCTDASSSRMKWRCYWLSLFHFGMASFKMADGDCVTREWESPEQCHCIFWSLYHGCAVTYLLAV